MFYTTDQFLDLIKEMALLISYPSVKDRDSKGDSKEEESRMFHRV
jgi:hypothetical protein